MADDPQTLTPEQCVDAFAFTVGELLSGLAGIFPECRGVSDVLEEFEKVIQPNALGCKMLIEKWHSSMETLYAACHNRDVNSFIHADLDILRRLKISDKWNDPRFTDESKTALWAFIDELNALACEYASEGARGPDQFISKLPSRMADKVRNSVQTFTSNLQSGGADISTFDPFSLAQNICDDMTEEEMQEFRKNIPMILQSLQAQPEGREAQAMLAQNPQMVMSMLGGEGAGGSAAVSALMNMMGGAGQGGG